MLLSLKKMYVKVSIEVLLTLSMNEEKWGTFAMREVESMIDV